MVYKKFIHRGEVVFGPYFYTQLKTPNGKVFTHFLGTDGDLAIIEEKRLVQSTKSVVVPVSDMHESHDAGSAAVEGSEAGKVVKLEAETKPAKAEPTHIKSKNPWLDEPAVQPVSMQEPPDEPPTPPPEPTPPPIPEPDPAGPQLASLFPRTAYDALEPPIPSFEEAQKNVRFVPSFEDKKLPGLYVVVGLIFVVTLSLFFANPNITGLVTFEDNSPPLWDQGLKTLYLNQPLTINLNDFVTDDDGDTLFFTATDVKGVFVSIDQNFMTLTPNRVGSASITLFASDDQITSASQEISLVLE